MNPRMIMRSLLSFLLLLGGSSFTPSPVAIHAVSPPKPLSTRSESTTTKLGASLVSVPAQAYHAALSSRPLLTKSVTAFFLLGAADLVGQVLEKKKDNDDGSQSIQWAPTARFAAFGLIAQAPWNHFFYQFLDGVLPPTPSPWTWTTAVKTFVDQFLQAPVFTALMFVVLGVLEGKRMTDIRQQIKADYKDTMIANWKLWVPATVINLAFVPPMFRVLYQNFVFFFWSIFLSIKVNNNNDGGSSSKKAS